METASIDSCIWDIPHGRIPFNDYNDDLITYYFKSEGLIFVVPVRKVVADIVELQVW